MTERPKRHVYINENTHVKYGETNEKQGFCPSCGKFSPCPHNALIDQYEAWEKENPKISGETSDGYHTFNELYDHRCLLWINLCNLMPEKCYLVPEHLLGWFLLGMETKEGQISYHCPNKFYDLINIRISKKHPKYDGHMSKDVIKRLKKLPFGTPKDAVSVPTVEEINKVLLESPRHKYNYETKEYDTQAKAIHDLITRKLKGLDNEDFNE